MSKKTENYTPEMIETLKKGYTGKDNTTEIPAIAEKIGRSPVSVRSKLATMGLYVKAEKPEGSKRRKKVDIVDDIINAGVELTEAERDGLAAATSSALEKVLAGLTN